MSLDQQPLASAKDIFRAIRILYALITGVVVLSLGIVGVNSFRFNTDKELKGAENIFLAVAAGIAVICFIAARNGYNKGVQNAKDPLIPLADKLNQYRNTLIRYLALCEMPAIFAAIVFFMSGNYLFLIITACMIAAMASKSPRLERLVADLDLDSQQELELE